MWHRNRKTPSKVSFDLPSKKPEIPSTSVTDLVQRIQDLCAEIDKANISSSCLGILDWGCTWHRLYTPASSPSCRYTRETISLEGLFVRGNLDKRDRLRLGVQLASGVMQLHATEWLNESWGKRDIHFFLNDDVSRRAADGKFYPEPVTNKPFLHRNFGLAPLGSSLQPTQIESPLVQYDRSLFSLGIILVELWFGNCLEDLPEYLDPQSNGSTLNNESLAYQTANQLIRRINEEGPIYGAAVRRCIRGLDCTATSLEEDELKDKVHTEVVSELERHWRAYDDRAK